MPPYSIAMGKPTAPIKRILSLDGGGIRGLISAHWIDAVEQAIQPRQVRDSFDLLAGTSTGSILACALSCGLKPADMIKLYQDEGPRIFPGPAARRLNRIGRIFSDGFSAPKYSNKGLIGALQNVFGTRLFGELPKPTMVVSYDTIKRKPVIFKSWRDEYRDLPVWQVCVASSSAPTYFPSFVMPSTDAASTSPDGERNWSLIDGGVVANNPAACVLAEALRLNRENKTPVSVEEIVLASIGTGQHSQKISAKKAGEWGAIEWAIPIIDVLFDGSTDAVDYVVQNILLESNYYRLQIALPHANDSLDKASHTNLRALSDLAQSEIERLDSVLWRLSDRLKKIVKDDALLTRDGQLTYQGHCTRTS